MIGCVVIGRNEGARLVRCLASIGKQGASVVYVDSGSTDGSVAEATRLGANVVHLDISRPFTAARARNAGFARLKALMPHVDYVQFIDGDCELAKNWLEPALAFLNLHQDVALVCGRRREREPERSVYNLMCDIEWNTPVGEAQACGGDSLVRVAAFENAGGFRADLMAGEEPELCTRLRQQGWKIWRLDADMTFHDAAMYRFGQWWKRCVRSGYGAAEVSWLQRDSTSPLYRRETRRAIVWGAFLPAMIVLASFVHWMALAGLIVYPVQVARLTLRGRTRPHSVLFGYFNTISKFPECYGVLKFHARRFLRIQMRPIEYKQ